MRVGWILLVSVALLLGCNKQKEAGRASAFDSLLAAHPSFSGVCLVASNGAPVFFKSVGFADFETQKPLTTDAVFELASVSKQFTAMVVVKLKDQGLLTYGDALEKFFPELDYLRQPDGPPITIFNLLTHTSGLPDYQAVMDEHWDKTQVAGNEACITFLARYKPPSRFSPGAKYEYSNTGYLLLASIAEKVTGKRFEILCNELIFNKIGMKSASIRTKPEKLALPEMAWGHMYDKGKGGFVKADSFPSSNYTIWLGDRRGPGRVSATAHDLLMWDKALRDTTFLNQSLASEIFTSYKTTSGNPIGYGFGWEVTRTSENKLVVRHNGDNPGYKTQIVRYVDSGKAIILLSNNAYENFNSLLADLERLVAREE